MNDRPTLIEIVDDTLRMALLCHFIIKAEEGGSELLEAGLTDEDVTILRSLTASSLVRVSDAIKRVVKVHIDVPGLLYAVRTVNAANEQSEQIVTLLEGGAPAAMMRQLFPNVARKVLDEFQRIVTAKMGRSRGRPRMPEADDRDQIHKTLAELEKVESNAPNRWIQLRKHVPQFNFAGLYSVYNEF